MEASDIDRRIVEHQRLVEEIRRLEIQEREYNMQLSITLGTFPDVDDVDSRIALSLIGDDFVGDDPLFASEFVPSQEESISFDQSVVEGSEGSEGPPPPGSVRIPAQFGVARAAPSPEPRAPASPEHGNAGDVMLSEIRGSIDSLRETERRLDEIGGRAAQSFAEFSRAWAQASELEHTPLPEKQERMSPEYVRCGATPFRASSLEQDASTDASLSFDSDA
eukprot:gnl/Chilomastix_cuspidata/1749.p1 GENE.gnl/Chilomastix_cuspidata/1749~~gnl/Chilomastix_cuspidata/1749.p1  ORF type:complete len:221 (+),score=56.20 gnl/Chilomastix_cuspidata/1749:41-703(+)